MPSKIERARSIAADSAFDLPNQLRKLYALRASISNSDASRRKGAAYAEREYAAITSIIERVSSQNRGSASRFDDLDVFDIPYSTLFPRDASNCPPASVPHSPFANTSNFHHTPYSPFHTAFPSSPFHAEFPGTPYTSLDNAFAQSGSLPPELGQTLPPIHSHGPFTHGSLRYGAPIDAGWGFGGSGSSFPTVDSFIPPPTPYATSPAYPSHEYGPWIAGTTIPYGTGMRILLHPCLVHNPIDARCPQIRWNIATYPVTNAKLLRARGVITSPAGAFNADATAPSTNSVYITVPAHPWMEAKWGAISVEKLNGKAVSIDDVLDAVFKYFQHPLTQEEYLGLVQSGRAASLLHMVNLRVAESTRVPDVERMRGFLRVDLIGMDERYFVGMEIKTFSDNTWQMFLSLGPAPGLAG